MEGGKWRKTAIKKEFSKMIEKECAVRKEERLGGKRGGVTDGGGGTKRKRNSPGGTAIFTCDNAVICLNLCRLMNLNTHCQKMMSKSRMYEVRKQN